jgi:hypothetical protein
MSLSTAIGMVSESLRNLLTGEMTLQTNVTILSPDENGGDQRVNLFLYKVQENSILKNMDWQVNKNDSTRLIPSPLSLNLYYLMTAYALNDPQTGNCTAHSILGEAMRVFYEKPIIPDDYLANDLKATKEQIKITLNSMDMEELSTVWSTFTKPYRLSVLYEVTGVQLDMSSSSNRTMARRVQTIGVPTIVAPFKPPVVESAAPLTGAIGAAVVVTFYGENLSGWKAYVTIMGKIITDGLSLTQDTFQVTIPNDLPAGFLEMRVTISHLFSKLFFFEVHA